MSIVDVEQKIPQHGDCWGHWRFDARYGQPSIDFVGPLYVGSPHQGYSVANPYWIPLARLNSPAALKHWIDHLEEKCWWNRNKADFLTAVKTLQRLGYIYRGKHYTYESEGTVMGMRPAKPGRKEATNEYRNQNQAVLRCSGF
jgi:hypothetical protein